MIEIAVQEIVKYDMVQVFERVLAGEKVVLTHNGKSVNMSPDFSQIKHDKTVHLSDLFEQLNVSLPKDYQFDREEANAR